MKASRFYLILFLMLPLVLVGQADSLSTYKRSLPQLNDHYFTPDSKFPSPFMTTFFTTGIGGGFSLNNIPVYAIDGDELLGTIESEDTYITADIHIQVEAKDWLAVWFRYQADVRIGSSTPTLFAHGVTAVTGFDFGWMFRLWHDKKSQLSATITIRNSTVSAVNVSNYIKDVIANPDSLTTPAYKEKNPLDGGAGLRYAYTFNNMIGLQAYINGSYGESLLMENNHIWMFDMGILGSLNFAHSHDIPLGFNLGYLMEKFTLFEDQQEDNSNNFIFKVAYTGRPEYNIGLEFTYVNTSVPLIEGVINLEYLTTTFVMVYYF